MRTLGRNNIQNIYRMAVEDKNLKQIISYLLPRKEKFRKTEEKIDTRKTY